MKQLSTPYIYIALILWNFSLLNAQSYSLKISIQDSIENPVLKSINFKEKHETIQSVLTEVDSLQLQFERYGYFNNYVDSLIHKDSVYTANFYLGKSTKKIKIFYDPQILTKKDAFRFAKKIEDDYIDIHIEEVPAFLNSLVSFFESQGKSFTRIKLTDILSKNDHLEATLDIKSSEKRNIDKVVITGYENFPKTFLKHFLDISPSANFSTQKIKDISERVKALPFVSESKPSEVLFTNDSTYLYLHLKKIKANRFDGLIGFTSDESTSGLDFNGYLDLELHNILNGGETIQLNWKNNANDRQVFNFEIGIPYMVNTPVTPE